MSEVLGLVLELVLNAAGALLEAWLGDFAQFRYQGLPHLLVHCPGAPGRLNLVGTSLIGTTYLEEIVPHWATDLWRTWEVTWDLDFGIPLGRVRFKVSDSRSLPKAEASFSTPNAGASTETARFRGAFGVLKLASALPLICPTLLIAPGKSFLVGEFAVLC